MPDRRSRFARMPQAFGLSLALLLAACSTTPPAPPPSPASVAPPLPAPAPAPQTDERYFSLPNDTDRREVVMFALGLLETGYRFGGRNPEAGLDCSGMVSYIVEQVSGQRLPHNASQIASVTRPIERHQLQPGDLVFFNTANRRHSHMGIYLGEGRFVHAPSSKGKVRVERLDSRYFAARFDGARSMGRTSDQVATR